MPIAIINIIEGRSEEKKQALLSNVSKAIADSLDAPLESVRVLIQEYPDTQWAAGGQTIAERRKQSPR
ncbi:2-hydroxymuconate tautomerase family protein [Pseudomonas bijieensis]|uniref:2-hydroxymuconate tautomerase family protein n=1 Tax=Pseudomonas bijieensis TaxID=2681983 RepID=UPI001E5B8785|nr:2-hydroxymuconate tautomerase family protein [Pseudomonas bijieensis]MCD9117157.1 2-hydroxymuconate tautomerase family protein [Pseudomonas bijieensis]